MRAGGVVLAGVDGVGVDVCATGACRPGACRGVAPQSCGVRGGVTFDAGALSWLNSGAVFSGVVLPVVLPDTGVMKRPACPPSSANPAVGARVVPNMAGDGAGFGTGSGVLTGGVMPRIAFHSLVKAVGAPDGFGPCSGSCSGPCSGAVVRSAAGVEIAGECNAGACSAGAARIASCQSWVAAGVAFANGAAIWAGTGAGKDGAGKVGGGKDGAGAVMDMQTSSCWPNWARLVKTAHARHSNKARCSDVLQPDRDF